MNREEEDFMLWPYARTTDTQWRHKSKISEKLDWCGRQNMLPPYLKNWVWDWIFGHAVKAISSLGVRSPWSQSTSSETHSEIPYSSIKEIPITNFHTNWKLLFLRCTFTIFLKPKLLSRIFKIHKRKQAKKKLSDLQILQKILSRFCTKNFCTFVSYQGLIMIV